MDGVCLAAKVGIVVALKARLNPQVCSGIAKKPSAQPEFAPAMLGVLLYTPALLAANSGCP
jgi:hypothetical protein